MQWSKFLLSLYMIPILTLPSKRCSGGNVRSSVSWPVPDMHLICTGQLDDHGHGAESQILHLQNEGAWAKWSLRRFPNLVHQVQWLEKAWPRPGKDDDLLLNLYLLLSKQQSQMWVSNTGLGILQTWVWILVLTFRIILPKLQCLHFWDRNGNTCFIASP